MWELAKNSIVLFFRGKLFQEPAKVALQVVFGVIVTALVLIALALGGVSVIVAAALAGFLGGMLQPYLFRNLKYR